ncbi:GGDEF domain-containing protein [Flocculibacter collagenilyticus]|uniref:GGDEF domain-containing protein n=1 Tax=Flocculibacter collagenilyticus TaxID=2744479 RepID=UPI001F34D3B7|nr:GGDEF domain-containing protein [Flocculibacter collagenilyticus]
MQMLDVVSVSNNEYLHVPSVSSYAMQENADKTSLIELLQTTLELPRLLEIFSMEAAKITAFNGLSFLYEGTEITVRGSNKGNLIHEFPLMVEDEVIGHLIYHTSEPINAIAKMQLATLHQKLGYPLRNAITFEKVQRYALVDSLTGLGNRRYFDETQERMQQRAARNDAPYVLMLLDLDNFKQVNDRYGHQAGDVVLSQFAQALKGMVRGNDTLFRFGGDEFAILLDNCDSNTANLVAQRIKLFSSTNEVMRMYQVSSSIGCARWKQEDNCRTIFSRADNALYTAKTAGKDCMKIA